mgnify:FL=1
MNCPRCGEYINEAQVMAYKRKDKLLPEKRKQIAENAAKTRWQKARNVPGAQDGPISDLP